MASWIGKIAPVNNANRLPEIMPGVWTRLSPAEIRSRLARVDVAVMDVDECLVPGYTQIELGTRLFRRMLGDLPRRPARIGQVIRLAGLGLFLYAIKISPLQHEHRNALLQKYFSRALAGVSREEIESLIPSVWRSIYPSASGCLRSLARRLPLGVISLGWDVIVAELPAAIADGDRSFRFLFTKANITVWQAGRFQGLQPPILAGAADKEGLFTDFCRSQGLGTPLVLGHNSDERLLCRLADERRGLSVGLGAKGTDQSYFHILLQGGGWQTLEHFFLQFWAAPPRIDPRND